MSGTAPRPGLRSLLAGGVAAALAAACAAPPWSEAVSPAPLAAIERGRVLAESRCAACHAVGPGGASPMAEAPPFRILHQRYPVDSLQEALAEGLTTAHPAMPEVELAPEQIEGLIAYLQSLE